MGRRAFRCCVNGEEGVSLLYEWGGGCFAGCCVNREEGVSLLCEWGGGCFAVL